MIFPTWYFDDYSHAAVDPKTRAEIAAPEELVQDPGAGGAPIGHATAIHIVGTRRSPQPRRNHLEGNDAANPPDVVVRLADLADDLRAKSVRHDCVH